MNFPVSKNDLLDQRNGGVDVREQRYGLPAEQFAKVNSGSAKTQLNVVGHPLQAKEEAHALEAVRQELAMAKRMIGSHFAQQLSMEMQACAQVGRHQSSIPSSRLMLNTLMGMDEGVTMDDVLNYPENSETVVDMSPMAVLKN